MNKSYNVLIMRDPVKILIAIILFFSIVQCQKEETYPPLKINATVYDVSEFGKNDGAIDLEISGGAPPYSCLWSTNDTTKNITGLLAGIYSVSVSDKKNQTVTDSFKVVQPAPDSLVIVLHFTNPSETGANDGTITPEIGGGYPPFTYNWSTGADTKNLEEIPAGAYSLTVNDSRGQELTESVILTDVVTDIDGNSYSIRKIGNQVWMGENLRVKHAPDSSLITSYVYQNDTTLELKNGRLYTWDAAMDGSTEEKAQGICPCGWHIPTDEEFKLLEIELGMTRAQADMANTWRGSPVGTMLKAGGSSGYNAQLGGRRSSSGKFSFMGRMEYMWTSTEYGGTKAWRRCLDNFSTQVGRWNTFPKNYGFSVRCIKDD